MRSSLPSSPKPVSTTRSIIAIGFIAMVCLLLAIGIGWIATVRHSTQHLNELVSQYENAMRVVTMRDAAQGRMLALSRMAMSEDPFQMDEEFLDFNTLATEFIQARDGMLAAGLRPEEQAIWFQARDLVRVNANAQSEVVEILRQGRREEALARISSEVTARQKAIHVQLQKQQILMQDYVRAELANAEQEGKIAQLAALGLGASAIILGLVVMWQVLVRSTAAERALVAAREEAQQANHFKSLFLANMSHEIRTPLTAVIGFAETLVCDRQSHKLRQEAARAIYNSGNHLLGIVNDILDISKIEAGQMRVDRIDFSPHEIVQEVSSQCRPRAEAKGIQLDIKPEFPLPATIHSDPVRFRQVLFNLVTNAIKFTDEGVVRIGLRHDADLNQLVVSVSDSGIGMSEEEQTRIFEPFVQADASTTRKYGGTGLGLAIARHLTKLLNGELRCTSVKGQGTIFTLSIDTGTSSIDTWVTCEEQFNTSPSMPAANEFGVPRLIGRVLLAEDTIENQQLIERYVKRTGASIVMVSDGQQAVERMENDDFDLVLMDVQMPVLGGVEATIQLRKLGYKQPIIAITANVLAEDRERYLQTGMTDVIEKPFNSAMFYSVISRYLPIAANRSGSGNPDDYSDMEDIRARFIERMPEMLGRLRDAMPKWQVLLTEAHQIKGLGSSLGFPDIGRIAKDAHEAMRSEDYEIALERLEQLVAEIEAEQARLGSSPEPLQAGSARAGLVRH